MRFPSPSTLASGRPSGATAKSIRKGLRQLQHEHQAGWLAGQHQSIAVLALAWPKQTGRQLQPACEELPQDIHDHSYSSEVLLPCTKGCRSVDSQQVKHVTQLLCGTGGALLPELLQDLLEPGGNSWLGVCVFNRIPAGAPGHWLAQLDRGVPLLRRVGWLWPSLSVQDRP